MRLLYVVVVAAALRRALDRVRQPDEPPIPESLPHQLLQPHTSARTKFKAAGRVVMTSVSMK